MANYYRDEPFIDNKSNIEDFEYNQSAKPMKAVIGLGILIAIVVGLWEFSPGTSDTASAPSSTISSSTMNRAPGQTTGQAPMTSPARPAAPSPAAK